MSERGPSFGGERFGRYESSRKAETPHDRLLRDLRGEVSRTRWETTNLSTIERAFLEKIDEKLVLKQQVDAIQAHRDDITVLQPLKRLGIFLIKDTVTQIAYDDPSTGLHIRPGDRIIDLHMPPVKEEHRTLASVTASLELVAQYIEYHNLDPQYIIGITYEKLANVSRRQGFTVVDPVIPERIRTGVENVYRRFTDDGRNGGTPGKIKLCYQTGEAFKTRYLKPRTR